MARKSKTVNTEDILVSLCQAVTKVLSLATNNEITYSAMVQKISRTCLRPDIGCFVLFDGGFNGIVVTNFTGEAALEVYQDYLKNMGMPDSEISNSYLSDDVGNVLGELMNQIVGDFIYKVREELQTSITQNQPRMMAISKLVQISVDTVMDKPQTRRVTFTTKRNNIFYLEFAMDRTEFIRLHDFEVKERQDPDDIIESMAAEAAADQTETPIDNSGEADDDFLAELGL